MHNKIMYRVVFNYNIQQNKRGESLVQIEARQGTQRKFFSTHIYLREEQFMNGLVTNHPNANQLNVVIEQMKHDIERIELEYILKGRYISVTQLKEFYKEKCIPSALLREFGMQIVSNSDRKESTQNGYVVLFNNIDKFRDNVRISDVDYNFIVEYDKWLRDSGVMDNTRIGRLQQLKTIMSEAYKRDVISDNPFVRFKIPSMTDKKGFLTMDDINNISKLKLKGKMKIVRDGFLLSVYTGLRLVIYRL